jgi:hypothetical protein
MNQEPVNELDDFEEGVFHAQCAIEVALNNLVDEGLCTNEQIIEALIWWSEEVDNAYPNEESVLARTDIEGTLQ